MASKRMFSYKIISDDNFLKMSAQARALYYQLAMNADDDGLVGNSYTVMIVTRATEAEIRELADAGFLIVFPSGVIAIRHWWIHNTLRRDRYTSTMYEDERAMLGFGKKKVYVEKTAEQVREEQRALEALAEAVADENGFSTDGDDFVETVEAVEKAKHGKSKKNKCFDKNEGNQSVEEADPGESEVKTAKNTPEDMETVWYQNGNQTVPQLRKRKEEYITTTTTTARARERSNLFEMLSQSIAEKLSELFASHLVPAVPYGTVNFTASAEPCAKPLHDPAAKTEIPTREQVCDYFKENGIHGDPEAFYRYNRRRNPTFCDWTEYALIWGTLERKKPDHTKEKKTKKEPKLPTAEELGFDLDEFFQSALITRDDNAWVA